MQEEKLYDILRYPVLTEKSQKMAELNKYVFKVDIASNKYQIKRAVEKIFSVKVDRVHVIRMKGKVKIFRRIKGVQNNYKKAIVTLEKGASIDLTVGTK